MRFRRKPTVIEAEQYREGKPFPKGVCNEACLDGDWRAPHVHTAHQNQSVILQDGDWIIPEPDGVHFYPCKPDIFSATYEQEQEKHTPKITAQSILEWGLRRMSLHCEALLQQVQELKEYAKTIPKKEDAVVTEEREAINGRETVQEAAITVP